MSSADSLKEELLRSDDDFRRLHEEHQACEARLAELSDASLLSQRAEVEEKQLKRKKLWLKDQMAAMMRQHEEALVSA